MALNLKKNDEIIIPGYGYMAAANLALLMGLTPVFADVDIDTFCVTADSIKKKITKRTKLIVVTHTYGNVCDLKQIGGRTIVRLYNARDPTPYNIFAQIQS